MKIAVLGAGAVGVPLARALASAGHVVNLANSRGPDTLQEIAESIGVHAAFAADAVRGVDAVVISVNPRSYESIRQLLVDVPDGVPVIDTGNYHPLRDGQIAALDEGQVEALWISEQLGRPVTKAWNAVLSQTLETMGAPVGSRGRIALPVSSDDPLGLEIASVLTNDSGFDPVVLGGLEESWRAQPGTSAYCTELPTVDLRAAIDRADGVHAPLRRDLCMQAFQTFRAARGALDREEIVRLHRAITLTPDPA